MDATRYGPIFLRPARLGGLLCAAVFLSAPAAALADPGRPGLDSASTAVYGQPGGQGKTVENLTPPTAPPGDRNQVADEVASNLDEITSPGGRGSAPEDTTAPTPASSGPGESSPTVVGTSELPFTGFAAALVLSLGLVALLAGAVLRRVAARPARA